MSGDADWRGPERRAEARRLRTSKTAEARRLRTSKTAEARRLRTSKTAEARRLRTSETTAAGQRPSLSQPPTVPSRAAPVRGPRRQPPPASPSAPRRLSASPSPPPGGHCSLPRATASPAPCRAGAAGACCAEARVGASASSSPLSASAAWPDRASRVASSACASLKARWAVHRLPVQPCAERIQLGQCRRGDGHSRIEPDHNRLRPGCSVNRESDGVVPRRNPGHVVVGIGVPRHRPGRLLVSSGNQIGGRDGIELEIPTEAMHPRLRRDDELRRRPVEREPAVGSGWRLPAHLRRRPRCPCLDPDRTPARCSNRPVPPFRGCRGSRA